MCRVDVEPGAVEATGALLRDLRDALAEREGVDPDSVTVGPVDLGRDGDLHA